MEKNIRNIRNEFKKNGIFYTTDELANTLKKYVDFQPEKIYDPTCGQGNLLSVFPDEIEKYGQELFADELEKAKERLKNFHGYVGDTLKDDGFSGVKFDLIVANPPFSIKWEPNQEDERFKSAPCVPTASKADYAFMLHIIHHLDDHGKAICLEFPGVLYRGNREGKIRRWMVEQNMIERVVHVPGNTFVDTAIATCVIVFNKSKHSTDIVFENLETGEEKTVSAEEVKDNDYTLSVSTYIYHEPEREEIDPIQIKADADNAFLQHIRSTLDFEKVVAEMEGRSILPLLTSIKAVLAEYEAETAAMMEG